MRARIALVAAALLSAPTAQAEPGRYQLVNVQYEFVNLNGEGYQEKELILLDTSTGEMYVCSAHQIEGKHLKREPDSAYQLRNCDQSFDQDLRIR